MLCCWHRCRAWYCFLFAVFASYYSQQQARVTVDIKTVLYGSYRLIPLMIKVLPTLFLMTLSVWRNFLSWIPCRIMTATVWHTCLLIVILMMAYLDLLGLVLLILVSILILVFNKWVWYYKLAMYSGNFHCTKSSYSIIVFNSTHIIRLIIFHHQSWWKLILNDMKFQ